MKTRFDDRGVAVCLTSCFYADADYEPGALVLADAPVVRHLPDSFERLADDDQRVVRFREELEIVRNRIEELDREEAQDRVRKQRERTGRQSEAAFWRDTAAFLAEAETRQVGLDELPDPALEAEEEAIAAERRRAQYDPDTEAFWDESAALVERVQAEAIFPAEMRRKADAEEERRRGK
jgi:hypothetical protein